MIFTFYIIDADNGILIFEKVFQALTGPKIQQNLGSGVIAEFFSAINTFIDEIQAAMKKGRDVTNMTRTLLAENSSVVMYYHPEARILISAISDPDDDLDIIVAALRRIGERFWTKHEENVEQFRVSMNKEPFKAFIPDVEMVLRDGHVAEFFPKLLIPETTLQRIALMGIITNEEHEVGKLLDGIMTPYSIAKKTKKSKDDIMAILKKFESLDMIKPMRIPQF
nr:hypothetical protein [Candidatus Sigynarchaeota archaeon]